MDYLFSLQSLREMSPDWINYFFIFISEVLVRGSFIIAGGIYWSINKKIGASIFITYSCSYSINQLIKNTACVYRPWILDDRLYVDSRVASTATGYSFPSGHTITAASIFGSIAAWFKNNLKLVITCFTVIFLVAFSRNWLGAHTLKDVITAIIEGGILVIISLYLSAFISKNPSKDILFCVVGCIFSIVILIFLCFKSYPIHFDWTGKILVDPSDMKTDCFTACGLSLGVFIGWILERRFINFSIEVSLKVKILRFIFGSLSFGILYIVLTAAFSFMNPYASHLIKYFIIMIFTMFLYPLIFTKIEKRKN